MAGYSGTPLVKKLGIQDGFIIRFINEPLGLRTILDLPLSVTVSSARKTDLDLVIFFTNSTAALGKNFKTIGRMIKKEGTVWIGWPKKTSRLAGDLNENIVREIGLATGLVDVKVCAIDEDWSGLKFVYRVKDR